MPPIGREVLKIKESQFNPEQEAELIKKSQDVYALMRSVPLRLPQEPWWKIFSATPMRSAVATYELPGEPTHVKMHAWLEELWSDEVIMKTQLHSAPNRESVPVENAIKQAYTYHGKLADCNGRIPHDTYEEKMQRLIDLSDTLELIAQAGETQLQQALGQAAVSATRVTFPESMGGHEIIS